MKIAVCISGAIRSNQGDAGLIRNYKRMKEKFPSADFYFATWNSFSSDFNRLFNSEKCFYFEEPKMHYHPYLDMKKENYASEYYKETLDWIVKEGKAKIEWSSHHTKQILIHAWLLDKITKEYDVIVRTRFDAFIFKNADFFPYLKDTVDYNRANAFATTRKEKFNELYDSDVNNEKMKYWMLDQLIIHTPNAINKETVDELHKNKKLNAAEHGWYQVLSKPQGSNHKNRHGWVNHDKNILDKFLRD
jgi:hypothetical protein